MDDGPSRRPKGVSFDHILSPDRRLSLQVVNEQSPLLLPQTSRDLESSDKVISPLGSDQSDQWDADAGEETKSSWYLFLLTLGGLGLQIGWSVETSNGSVSIPPCIEHRADSHTLQSPISSPSVSASRSSP
jgi:solute carrier family 45 protein 1/2/4